LGIFNAIEQSQDCLSWFIYLGFGFVIPLCKSRVSEPRCHMWSKEVKGSFVGNRNWVTDIKMEVSMAGRPVLIQISMGSFHLGLFENRVPI
jgi:hypothetical protein